MTDEESKFSTPPEFHAATGVAMIGLIGPKEDLNSFIREWVPLASAAAINLAADYPQIQLIPMEQSGG